jgi:hypothetical protein
MTFSSIFIHITSAFFFFSFLENFQIVVQKKKIQCQGYNLKIFWGKFGTKLQYFEEKKFEVSIFGN